MVNLVAPDLLAVKISPTPFWSTNNEAMAVAPEIEATGTVPRVERMSKVANGAAGPVVPTVTKPPLG